MKKRTPFPRLLFFGILILTMISSCYSPPKPKINEQKSEPAKEVSIEKKEKPITATSTQGVEGDWSSSSAQEYLIKKITIKHLGENRYSETITAIDGSSGTH